MEGPIFNFVSRQLSDDCMIEFEGDVRVWLYLDLEKDFDFKFSQNWIEIELDRFWQSLFIVIVCSANNNVLEYYNLFRFRYDR